MIYKLVKSYERSQYFEFCKFIIFEYIIINEYWFNNKNMFIVIFLFYFMTRGGKEAVVTLKV